jgi:hypothetical protein
MSRLGGNIAPIVLIRSVIIAGQFMEQVGSTRTIHQRRLSGTRAPTTTAEIRLESRVKKGTAVQVVVIKNAIAAKRPSSTTSKTTALTSAASQGPSRIKVLS